MEAPGFWDNPDYSNKKMKELKNLKDTVEQIDHLSTQYEDIETLIEMGNEEEDESMAEEIRSELDSFTSELETLRISTLLTGEYDKNDAILKLNAGAGGTESCDWCSMLYRMYCRWAESKGFSAICFTRRSDSKLARMSDLTFLVDASNQTLISAVPNQFFGKVILAFEELIGRLFR